MDLLKNTDYNANISGLTTTVALTAVEKKIADVSNLVRKIDYSAIILEYFTAADYNELTSQTLDEKVKQNDWLINLLLLDS